MFSRDDISVNIANPKDLAELRSLFPNQDKPTLQWDPMW